MGFDAVAGVVNFRSKDLEGEKEYRGDAGEEDVK
jgi:hypothetical protein